VAAVWGIPYLQEGGEEAGAHVKGDPLETGGIQEVVGRRDGPCAGAPQ